MTKIHPLYKTAFQSDAYRPLANRTAGRRGVCGWGWGACMTWGEGHAWLGERAFVAGGCVWVGGGMHGWRGCARWRHAYPHGQNDRHL